MFFGLIMKKSKPLMPINFTAQMFTIVDFGFKKSMADLTSDHNWFS